MTNKFDIEQISIVVLIILILTLSGYTNLELQTMNEQLEKDLSVLKQENSMLKNYIIDNDMAE